MKPIAAALALALVSGAAAAQPIATTAVTNTGQPIVLPQGPVQVSAQIVTIPAGSALPVHKHPYPRYGYVQQGRVRVINSDTGEAVEFGPGDFIVESLGQWHTGLALGEEDVKLLVIDQSEPGHGNVVLKD